ncbi:MAG: efflux RND transporter periplasmic adaptor subunit [Deltaproteobacteria bacterium]|nr:MAG: efflux RND transporter periplasmic adaptor subunit [Deltaproteobacteria bacterium]
MHRFRISLALVAIASSIAGCRRGTADTYRTDPVSRGPVVEMVSATGEVSAIITVNIGSQVSGTISKLFVDFNSTVKKGQRLAQIDPRLFQAALEKAQGGLASAEADVAKATAALHDAERLEKRNKELFEQKLVSQQDVDSAVATREQAAATLSGNRAKVLQARADRDQAAANLAYTSITSPIDGIVVSRAVDVGQTVAASFQTPTLFTIANDLTKMQILANIDEADVGKVHEGAETVFTVDAYAGEEFRGSIREVRQAPTTINNVVTYAAVIDAPNPLRKLRQGMTAAVKVLTSRQDDVLRVANAALRWKPENAEPVEGAPARGAPQGGGDRTMARTAGERRPSHGEQQSDGGAPSRGRPARVYKLVAGKPVAVNLRVGISDGQRTAVLDGALAEGDAVIVAEGGASPGASRPAPSGARRVF